MAIVVEWQRPYTWGTGVEIDWNKVISVLLREENNLILVNNDNELYTDLQLADWIEPDDDLPVGVTVGKVLEDDWWEQNGLLLNWKTTSWDYARWIYWADGKIYFDWWTWERSQVYYSSEVDDLFTALRNSLANVAFTGDYNDLINRPTLPVVYDGTLTIQKNGTTVWDFTANQQANETINITVPVNTSDLNNDSWFIDKNVNDLTYYTATADLATVATTWAYSDLSGTPNLATVATTWDYDDLLDKPNLATVATSGDYNDLTNKPTIPAAQVQSNWTESDNTKVDYIKNKPNLATVATSGSYSDLSNTPNLATVATSGSYADLSNKPTIPSVLDSVSSTSTTDALSANQGKNLQDQINDLKAMWKFLSLWNASTGQPISFPHSTPYTYSTWDYYLVETVSTANPPANKRPSGSSYTWAASTTAETDELEIWDLYIYDWSVWLLQINHGKTVSFANLAGQPTDNAALSTALGAKADTSSLATVATTGSYSDLSNKPTIPAAQVQSNWTESDNTKVEYIKNKPTLATVATSWAYSDLSGTPSLATVATTWSYSDLSNKPTIPAAQVNSDWDASSGVAQILNKPTIPTVNNATLTITQNGTSVGTFTANASSNVTIATTDTTYQSKSAASGWTAVSLVTTGEKYTWNNKQDAISNLSTIESWAAAWATAVQPWDLATVATTGSYSDLSNQPTIPSVYDATITFTQWWTSKWDITLNQSSNETIALDAWFTPWGTATTWYVVTKTANWYEWAAPSSWSWDVVWPASSTDWNIATYDWATGKLIKDSGVAVTDLNTKTFYLTGTTGSTNMATATAALAWYNAGKNPIISFSNLSYILVDVISNKMTFRSGNVFYDDWGSYTDIKQSYLYFLKNNNNVVTAIYAGTQTMWNYLRTWKNYSTPYTPEYNGSPATKKYVDDRAVPTSWTTGYVLTKTSDWYWWAAASGWYTTATATLTSAWWSSKSQTVSATGVTASNTVIVSPAPSSIGDYAEWGVYASAQWSGTLTFSCDTEPTNDITVNVLIFS